MNNLREKTTVETAKTVRIGTLLMRTECVTPEDFQWALDIAKRTDQPIGTVLLKERVLQKRDLSYALYLQSMVNKGQITTMDAIEALQLCLRNMSMTAEEALAVLGHKSELKHDGDLGEILVQAGWLNASLRDGLRNSKSIAVDLRVRGALSYRRLDEAFKALFYIKRHGISQDKAVAALLRLSQSKETVGDILYKDGELQRSSIKIFVGELLHDAAIVTEMDLLEAVEFSIMQNAFLGKTLVKKNLISEEVLKAALQLQELVAKNVLTRPQAATVLRELARRNVPIEKAMSAANLPAENPTQVTDVLEMLQVSGCIRLSDIEEARNNWISKFGTYPGLMATGKISRGTLEAVLELQAKIDAGTLNRELAIMQLAICARTGYSLTQLKEHNQDETAVTTKDDDSADEKPVEEIAVLRTQLVAEKKMNIWIKIGVVLSAAAIGCVIANRFVCAPLRILVDLAIGICVLLWLSHGLMESINQQKIQPGVGLAPDRYGKTH